MSLTVGIISCRSRKFSALRKVLEKASCNVLFETENIDNALPVVEKFSPDLILVEAQSENLANIILLVKEFPSLLLHVYVTSVRDKELIKACSETAPLGYISTPLKDIDVFTILTLAKAWINRKQSVELSLNNEDFIVLTFKGQRRKIFTDSILYIEAWGNYVKINLQNGDLILYKMSICKLLEQLNPDKFIRIHRRIIANRFKLVSGNFRFLYIGAVRLAVGRNYSKDVKKCFAKK